MRTWNFEEQLQDALAAHPYRVATEKYPGPYVLLGREFQLGNYRADLIFGNKIGEITIVEAKLRRNREFKYIIDQSVEYRNRLVGNPMQYAADLMQRLQYWTSWRESGSISYLQSNFGDDWIGINTPQSYQHLIESQLQKRNVRILLASDAFNDEVAYAAKEYCSRYGCTHLELVEIRPNVGISIRRRKFIPGITKCIPQCAFLPVDWENIQTTKVLAANHKLRRDRFNSDYGCRVRRVTFPEYFYLESAPARAPHDKLYIHQTTSP